MHLFAPGHAGCPGCAPSTTLIQICDTLGKDIIVVNATGCMEITSSQYPNSAWRVPYVHSLFENAPAVASGVVTALRAKGNHHTTVVVIAGDGSTYDIGFGSLSGMLERGDDVLYVCLHPDEELVLGDGSVQKIGELVETQLASAVQSNQSLKFVQEMGFVSTASSGNVLSFDGKKFTVSGIERVQKKTSPQTLIQLRTRSGGSVRVTPEHPILVDSVLGPVWKRADMVTSSDRLFSVRELPVSSSSPRPRLDALVRIFFGSHLHESSVGFTLQGAKPFAVEGILDEDIAYFLGLICSEGSLPKNKTVTFTNKDPELIALAETIFSNRFSGRKINRVVQNGVTRLTFSHPGLYALCSYFDVKNDPKRLLSFDNILLAHFLAGCFDGDGCASIITHKNTTKEARVLLTTVKPILGRRIKLMLSRLGVACSMLQSKRHDAIIYSRTDLLRFAERIPSRSHMKRSSIQAVVNICTNRTSWRTRYFDLAPLSAIGLIQSILNRVGQSGEKLDGNWSEIARGKRGLSKNKLQTLIPKLSETATENERIELQKLASPAFFMDPIVEVRALHSDTRYVYDLTVSNTHSFVPANALFTISNCYDNELYANTGVQKSGATPFGAATTTSQAGKVHHGKENQRKRIVEIAAQHNIPYAASASIAFMADFKIKLKKAQTMKGPRFITVHAPCCLGAGFDGGLSMKVARTAVQSRLWFLFQIENGRFKLDFNQKAGKPVAEYLTMQKRFAHLSAAEMEIIQKMADKNYADMLSWHERDNPI